MAAKKTATAKKKPTPPAKRGHRQLANIDEAEVARLALTGASYHDLGAILGVDKQTIHNRFKKLVELKRAERRLKIREAQMKAAAAGNPAVLIWLGKTELDQAEQQKTIKTEVVVRRVDRDIDGQSVSPPSSTAEGPE